MDPIVDLRTSAAPSIAISRFMNRVYGWMAFGLLITAVVAFVIGSDPVLFQHYAVGGAGIFFVVLQFGLLFGMTLGLNKMSVGLATFCFLLFSFTMGITTSFIFLEYALASIGQVFLITAAMFGGLALYGATTKKDLTAIGSACFAGLIGLIIASVVNVFFVKSGPFDFALSILAVIIFSGLTAWDNQKLKRMATGSDTESDLGHKLAVLGALALYLDFLNLFLALLRIFGGGRRRS